VELGRRRWGEELWNWNWEWGRRRRWGEEEVGRRELVELGGTEEEPEKLVNWGSGGGGSEAGGGSGGERRRRKWRNQWNWGVEELVLPDLGPVGPSDLDLLDLRPRGLAT
jgi:hypothetical protein